MCEFYSLQLQKAVPIGITNIDIKKIALGYKFMIRCFKLRGKVQYVLVRALTESSAQINERGENGFVSKQLSVCSVVLTLNSHMPENTAGTKIFDESVAEWLINKRDIST